MNKSSWARESISHWLQRMKPNEMCHISEWVLMEAFPGDLSEQGLEERHADMILFAYAADHKPPPRFRSPQEQMDDFFRQHDVEYHWNYSRRYIEIYRKGGTHG